MDELINQCPCSSGLEYEKCCRPYHEGRLAENALVLMRSRYSAYVLNLPDYIIATTHPASPQYSENMFSWKRGISRFSKTFTFQKLEVLDFKENGRVAIVTFTARITQEGQDASFTERSFFDKVGNRWLYRVGQLAAGHAPNMVTTGQLKILPLAYYGDPVLQKKSDPILKITDDLKKLVEEMLETLECNDGSGLAAPQVHHLIRLFLIRPPVENEKGQYEHGAVKVFINPKLSEPSKEMCTLSEGCLSIPALYRDVERPKEITVEYMNLQGEVNKERVSGWEARIIMHENDHINGVLFIDRLERVEREKLEPYLTSLKARLHDPRAL